MRVRCLATLCLVLCCLMAAPIQSFAADMSPARQSLELAVNRILACIKNPDYVNPATRGPLRQQIEDEILNIFDFQEFSSRTVGPQWRNFSEGQRKAFSDAFAELLLNTYLGKIDGYNGERFEFLEEKTNEKGDRTELSTSVTMKDGKKVPVAYRMLPKGGGWRVYDVLIEGISLVRNYRTQFQDILRESSPDQLIQRVKAKAEEARTAKGKNEDVRK